MKTVIREIFTKADKVRIGYGAAFLLLLVSLSLTTASIKRFMKQVITVDETNSVLISLGSISSGLADAETGVRGYYIMKEPVFLTPFLKSRQMVDTSLAMLARPTAAQAVDSASLSRLRQMVVREYDLLYSLAEPRNTERGLMDNTNAGFKEQKLLMDSIRVCVLLMLDHAKGTLLSGSRDMSKTATAIQTINITSLIVSFILAFYSFITFNSENRAREKADQKANDYRKRLEARISELRKVNAELITLKSNEKFASTGRIARTIAHEVRNPLTNINLANDQLREEQALDHADAHILLDMVSRNSARINQLVTELLSATRFSELNFVKRTINALLDEALTLAADRIELKHITVSKRSYAKDCIVEVDEEKLRIAFLNIIVNAVEAMTEGKGILTIETASQSPYCLTYITDNGHGLDEEALQKIFEPYFTSKATGSGLGMTNTQNIILNHKGSIRVDSTVGQGTTFIVSLLLPPQ